jgi:hypothetical protein
MAVEWFPTDQIVHKIGTTEAYRVWYCLPISGGRTYQVAPLGEIPQGSMGYSLLSQLLKLKRMQ